MLLNFVDVKMSLVILPMFLAYFQKYSISIKNLKHSISIRNTNYFDNYLC